MTQVSDQFRLAIRLGIGPFAMLLALAQFMPGLLPPGFWHLAPGLDQMSTWKLVAHLSNHAFLFAAGLWLLLGGPELVLMLVIGALVAVYGYEQSYAFALPPKVEFMAAWMALAIFLHLLISRTIWERYGSS